MRKTISFLLGAGFSFPMGYPIGRSLNEGLLNFDLQRVCMSPDGTLCTAEGTDNICKNTYTDCLNFCIRLMHHYAGSRNFDYEEFYDFIKSPQLRTDKSCEELCNEYITDTSSYEYFVGNLSLIYNQMVASLIKDANGEFWYDNLPYQVERVEKYHGFLSMLKKLKSDCTINVHTLNHDLLFESFGKTDYINGDISDGFDEYGSNYFAPLKCDERVYNVRLERYTARYNKPIRLYKLHGSMDYILYHRRLKNGECVPEKYVKVKYKMGYDILRGKGQKLCYESDHIHYHADFLTGTTSKIKMYKEPFLFRKLFKKFKNNLNNSEILIIIGYGCRDAGINEMVKNEFKGKSIYIVDPHANQNEYIRAFAENVNAKIIEKGVGEIDDSLFSL